MPACLATEFRCDNNRCIPFEYYCDGDNDCMDKSDEKNCMESCDPNSQVVIYYYY